MQGDLSRDDLSRLTQAGFHLLDAWALAKDEQLQLLGLPVETPARFLNRYRFGTPLPVEGDYYVRILLLMQIDNTLKKLFPHSQLSANLWVTTANPRFGGEPPLVTMLQEGLEGIRQVEHAVNCPEVW